MIKGSHTFRRPLSRSGEVSKRISSRTDLSVSLQEISRNFYIKGIRISTLHLPGRESTLVLLHGNSSCKEIFQHQINFLARSGMGILAIDLPGHGASGDAIDPISTYSFPGYARLVREVLNIVEAKIVDVFGWSLGGHIALELSGTDKRIRAVMIAGTPPVTLGPNAISAAFLPSPAMSLAGKGAFTADDARLYGEHMLGGKDYLTSTLLKAIYRTDPNARSWMVRNGLAGRGLNERRLVESAPNLLGIVHGLRDPFVSVDYLRSLQYRNLWKQEVQIIPDAGHAPHWQTTRSFNSILGAFLSDVGAMGHRRV